MQNLFNSNSYHEYEIWRHFWRQISYSRWDLWCHLKISIIAQSFLITWVLAYCLLLYRVISSLCLTRAIQNTICKSASFGAVNEFIQKANFGTSDPVSRGLQKVLEASKSIFFDAKDRLFVSVGACGEARITFNSLEQMIEYTKVQAELILNYFMKFVFMLEKEISKEDLTDDEKIKFKSNNFDALYSLVYSSNDGSSDIATMAQCSRFFMGQFVQALNRTESEKLLQVSEFYFILG